jgi:lantibiotic biosynthesis protein
MFKDFGKVVVRTPLYSYKCLFDADNRTLDLDDVVAAMLRDPVFIEGLYWSSPQLLEFVNGNTDSSRKQKLLHTLKKYAIRASTRSTPYGIYAGCGLAGGSEGLARKVRTDMGLMQQIVKKMESVYFPELKYRVNNSLYVIAGQYRFTEIVADQYQISSVEQTEVLDRLIGLNETLSIAEMYARLEITGPYEEFEAFVKELVETQLLVSELQLGVTTSSVLPFWGELFEKINAALHQFEVLPLGVLPVEEIRAVEDELARLGVEVPQRHIFHADLRLPVPDVPLPDMEKAIVMLSKISHTVSPLDGQLSRFRKRFTEKYETLEVGLAEALDPEFGVGFPVTEGIGNMAHNSFTEKVNLQSKSRVKKAGEVNAWLQDKIEKDVLTKEIQLVDKDVEDKSGQLANYFTVMGAYVADGRVLIHHVGGAHANVLLGRFAHLGEIGAFCKELALSEINGNADVVFAEIVHLPEGRVGNVVRREPLYEYEIPFLAAGGVDAAHQLPISDLMVSIRRDEIIIRSVRLNKRVIPRLSSAHNYGNSSIPVYKFLAALQSQDTPGFEINWGTHVKRFLPRIVYKRFILYRATWFLRESDLQEIFSSDDQLSALKAFLVKWSVSRLVSFCEGDNELFIDLSNDRYVEVLLKEMKGCSVVKLVEWLETSGQFVMPMMREKPVCYKPALFNPAGIQRVFEPGSEWTYYKIYCGAKASEEVLLHVVKPLLESEGFFIRYTDPHYHIRLRLHRRGVDIYEVLHPYLESKVVWKVQQDTYQREIERYGEGQMLLTEQVFYYDSLLFLDCLPAFEEDEQLRFLAGVKNMDAWLSLYGLSVSERVSFCTEMSEAFAGEFGREVKRQLNTQYNEWRKPIAEFLKGDQFNEVFAVRASHLKNLSIDNISSYIHMSMNRWFTTDQRFMEYMSYYFCGKYYNQLLHGAK